MLRLKTKTTSMNIRLSFFAHEISAKKIPCINLNTRFGRPHF